MLLRISSAHANHWSRACHVIFKRAHRFENSTKHIADDLCVNLVCEYFCWMLGDPHFFFSRSLSFLTLFIILKNKKNLCVGSFNYFSYTLKKRVELKAFMQKGHISLFWPIFIFCRIELIFGRLTCFDMKSIVP